MKVLLLTDLKITEKELALFQTEFTELFKLIGLNPEIIIQRHDYTNVPTFVDTDGDVMPTQPYVKGVTDSIYAKYDTYGVDHIFMLVHRHNWVYTGIWGTNWSNIYRQYHVHLCRFDHRNMANSLGTAFHEWGHSLDSLVTSHTGVEIDDYFKHTACFVDWDSTVIHGNRFRGCSETPYTYIRWKDNLDAFRMIAPDLTRAYKVREELRTATSLIVKLQLTLISMLRTKLKKAGVPRGT